MSTKATIVISGMIASDHSQGGAAWAVLQYVLGLRRLGYYVLLIEPVKPGALEDRVVTSYFDHVTSSFGLEGCAALHDMQANKAHGLPAEVLADRAGGAAGLINISGMLTDPLLTARIPVRVYLDLDPAFNQLWQAADGLDMRFEGHTHFVTIGLNIGESGCSIPTCGREWIKTLQPVVLEQWPVSEQIEHDALTTVANWRGYGSIRHEGVVYGQKAHSLRPLLPLPKRTSEQFILALSIHPDERKDIEALLAHGWHLVDPLLVADTPGAYRAFVRGSKAEFGLAKSGYVVSRCGWFSDRSACYLASGRPVIAQDTGFGRHLATGEGLFVFKDADDVLTAIDAIRADYRLHARRARELAESCFDSDRVLGRLLAQVGLA